MFVQIFGDLGAFLGYIFVHIGTFHLRGSLEASHGSMLEVIGAVGSMLKALLLLFTFLRRCWSTWLLFLCRLTWAGSLFG